MASAILYFLFFDSQIKNAAAPILAYNSVQTGPKTQFGGEKAGLLNPAYQVGIDAAVKEPLSIPTLSHRTIANVNFQKRLIR